MIAAPAGTSCGGTRLLPDSRISALGLTAVERHAYMFYPVLTAALGIWWPNECVCYKNQTPVNVDQIPGSFSSCDPMA